MSLVFDEYTGTYIEQNSSQFPVPNIGADYAAPNNFQPEVTSYSESITLQGLRFDSWSFIALTPTSTFNSPDGLVGVAPSSVNLYQAIAPQDNKFGFNLLETDGAYRAISVPMVQTILNSLGLPFIICGFCIGQKFPKQAGISAGNVTLNEFAKSYTKVSISTEQSITNIEYGLLYQAGFSQKNTIEVPSGYGLFLYDATRNMDGITPACYNINAIFNASFILHQK
jgi:hypothetical protein